MSIFGQSDKQPSKEEVEREEYEIINALENLARELESALKQEDMFFQRAEAYVEENAEEEAMREAITNIEISVEEIEEHRQAVNQEIEKMRKALPEDSSILRELEMISSEMKDEENGIAEILKVVEKTQLSREHVQEVLEALERRNTERKQAEEMKDIIERVESTENALQKQAQMN